MEKAKLIINNLHLSFEGLKTLVGVSMEVKEKTLHAIIGPNGAGKSCLLNCISGFYKPQKGEIWCGDQNLLKIAPDQIARQGISRTFQNIELFSKMSVFNNLMMGRHRFMQTGVLRSGLYWGPSKRQEKQHREALTDIISMLNLEKIVDQKVGGLPYGLQKRVELGRALASEPSVLLLDEPVAGMNSTEKDDIIHYIQKIREKLKLTIILIEHDMKMVMGISDYITVLNFGEKIAEGVPSKIQNDDKVIEAYLGTPKLKQLAQ